MTVQITITHDEPESSWSVVVVDTYDNVRTEIEPGESQTVMMHSSKNLVLSEVPKSQ